MTTTLLLVTLVIAIVSVALNTYQMAQSPLVQNFLRYKTIKGECEWCGGAGGKVVNNPEWGDMKFNCAHCDGTGVQKIKVSRRFGND